ncbi:hypothetical protein OAA06_02180 [bacterium]|nr:hypothetical protein [bacterium]
MAPTDMITSLKTFKNNKTHLTIYKGVGHNVYELAWKDPELIDWVFKQKKQHLE